MEATRELATRKAENPAIAYALVHLRLSTARAMARPDACSWSYRSSSGSSSASWCP
jgi:hypothetical protein